MELYLAFVKIGFTSFGGMSMVPQIPNIENYLAAMLAGFFDVQRSFRGELDRLRREDEVTTNKE